MFTLLEGAEQARWPRATREDPQRSHVAARMRGSFSFADTSASASEPSDPDDALIRAQPLCVASSAWSFGKLGDVVLFVHERRGDELRVGYFVYFDVERPWGNNSATYAVLPALAIDAVYSHFLFVFPGVQRLLYGPGDVEGASVQYRVTDTGGLLVESGTADDDRHRVVALAPADLQTTDGRVVLMTDVWSHQLGAPGAADYAQAPNARVRCFQGAALQPLSAEVAQSFRLGSFEHPRRARPAWGRVRRP